MDEAKQLIKKYLDKWMTPLGLMWWKTTVVYYDDPAEIIKHFRTDDNMLVLAVTFADWKYMEATIEINLPAWTSLEERDIEECVVHELMHILVNEMREGEIHHEERVVSGLTKAVFWIEDAIRKEIKD